MSENSQPIRRSPWSKCFGLAAAVLALAPAGLSAQPDVPEAPEVPESPGSPGETAAPTLEGPAAAEAPSRAADAGAAAPTRLLISADSNAPSLLLAARLQDRFPPLSRASGVAEVRLRSSASLGVTVPQWRVDAEMEFDQPGVPDLAWRQQTEQLEGLDQLPEQLHAIRQAALGLESSPLPAGAGVEAAVATLAAEDPTAKHASRRIEIGRLAEASLLHPQTLETLFAPRPAPDSDQPWNCLWLDRWEASAGDQASRALLEQIILPLGIEAQLLDPRPSLALYSWAVTLPQHRSAGLEPLENAGFLARLRAALTRQLDPEIHPHWPDLRGQLRAGLLHADRNEASAESPFARALRQALESSGDGDDRLLRAALALHHFDPPAETLRQETGETLWQARELWLRYPDFRPYLAALARDIARDLDPQPFDVSSPQPGADDNASPAPPPAQLLDALRSLAPDRRDPGAD